MKIAQVVCVYPPYKSGVGNCAKNFAGVNGSIEQTVLTPKYKYIKKQSEPGVLRLRPLLRFGNAAFLPQLVLKLRTFDIVHFHYPFFGAVESMLLAKIIYGRRLKLIVHYHMDTPALPWTKKIFALSDRLCRHWLFKKADAITCASLDYIKHSEIKDFYAANKEKFHELPFGVDLARFKPLANKEAGGGDLKMLFLGGLDKAHYFKGLEVLLESLSEIKNESWRLDVAGEGDMKGEYMDMARRQGLDGRISFLGLRSDEEIAEIYRRSDIFIFPSINSHEAFGIVLLEALASGLPVIASDLPGVRTVFKNETHGWYVRPGNAKDLRDKILKAVNDRETIREMGLAGRKLAEEKYDWSKIRSDLKKIYENMLDK
jgi:glycosyltransferase involved in cell wall biosynthesis